MREGNSLLLRNYSFILITIILILVFNLIIIYYNIFGILLMDNNFLFIQIISFFQKIKKHDSFEEVNVKND
jgi:hypothetical protein